MSLRKSSLSAARRDSDMKSPRLADSKLQHVELPITSDMTRIQREVAILFNKYMLPREELIGSDRRHGSDEELSTTNISKSFQDDILPIIFGVADYQGLFTSFFEESKKYKTRTVCGRVMKKNEIGFQCLDCQLDGSAIICQQCYERSNHKGHRIYQRTTMQGVCDCGDKEAWAEDGFCTDHRGFTGVEVKYETIPPLIRENLPVVFWWLFQYMITYFETYYDFVREKEGKIEEPEDDSVENDEDPIIARLTTLSDAVLDLLRFFSSATLHIGHFMSRELMIQHPCNILSKVDEENTRANVFRGEATPYNGSIVELLIRFNCFLTQKMLTELFVSSFFIDYEFKKALIIGYTKLFSLIIEVRHEEEPSESNRNLEEIPSSEISRTNSSASQPNAQQNPMLDHLMQLLLNKLNQQTQGRVAKPKANNKQLIIISGITDLALQLFTADELTVAGVECGHFDNIIEVPMQVLSFWVQDINSTADPAIFRTIFSHFYHSTWKESSCQAVIRQETTVLRYFDLLAKLQCVMEFYPTPLHDQDGSMHFRNITDTKLTEWLEIEIFVMKPLRKLIKHSRRLSKVKEILTFYLKKVIGLINAFKAQRLARNIPKDTLSYTLHMPLQRAFVRLLLAYAENLSGVSQTELLSDYMLNKLFEGDVDEFSSFVRYNIVELSKLFGFAKCIQRGILGTTPTQLLQRCIQAYNASKIHFFEYDITGLQLLLPLVDPSEVFMLLQRGFCDGSGEYLAHVQSLSLATNESNPPEMTQTREKLCLLFEESLNFLSFLCIDELSIVQCFSRAEREGAKEGTSPSPEERKTASMMEEECNLHERIASKTVGTALCGLSSVTMQSLKQSIVNVLPADDLAIDHIVSELATFDQGTKYFRRKPGVVEQWDPFLLYRDVRLFNNVYTEVVKSAANPQNKQQEMTTIDVHVGTPGALKLVACNYLAKVRESLLVGGILPFCIVNCLILYGAKGGNLLRYLLKLTQIMLFTADDLCRTRPGRSTKLIPCLQTHLISPAFEKLLRVTSQSQEVRRQFEGIDTSFGNLISFIERLKVIASRDSPFMKEVMQSGRDCLVGPAGSSPVKTEASKEVWKKKQEELRRRMMERQSAILQNVTATMEQEAQTAAKEKNEANCCCFCHDPLDDSQAFGTVGYVTRSNLVQIGQFQRHMLLCLDANANKLNPSLDELSDMSKWNVKDYGYPVLTTCQHYLHYKCYLRVLQAEHNEAANEIFGGDADFLCCLCRTLCNMFIPVPTEAPLHGTPKEVIHGFPQNFDDFGALMNALAQQVESRLRKRMNIEEEAPQLTRKRSSREEETDKEIMPQGDSSIMNTIIQNLALSTEAPVDMFSMAQEFFKNSIIGIEIVGFIQFLTKDFMIFQQFLRHFFDTLFYPRGVYTKNYNEELRKALKRTQDDMNALVKRCNDPQFITSDLDVVVIDLIWGTFFWFYEIKTVSTNNPDAIDEELITMLGNSVRSFMLLLAALKFVQIAMLKSYITSDTTHKVIPEPKQIIKRLYDFTTPTTENLEIIRIYNVWLRHVIVAGFALDEYEILFEKRIFRPDPSAIATPGGPTGFGLQFQELTQHCMAGEWEEYMSLSNLVNLTLERDVAKYLERFGGLVDVWVKAYASHVEKNVGKVEVCQIGMMKEISFNLANLAENYQELHQWYMEKKCELCSSFTNIGSQFVCLICGMSLCSIACDEKDYKKASHIGNLTKHTAKYHASVCIFISLNTSFVHCISGKHCVQDKPLYVDEFGQSFVKKSDWSRYKLDVTYVNAIRNAIVANRIPQLVCNAIVTSQRKYHDNQL